jgi:hypothetical protein
MVLYRYNRCYEIDGQANIDVETFPVIRETAKSYFIHLNGAERRISKDGKKRYAYPTKEEALINFKKRTQMCVKILRSRLAVAISYLDAKEIDLSLSVPMS